MGKRKRQNIQNSAHAGEPKRLEDLEKSIGYTFRDRNLIRRALTHSSYANERRGNVECYERLEFLGDSILGFVTAEFLYRHEPPIPEGRMTKLRAELVCEQNLYKVSAALGLGECMLLGVGEEKSGGRERVSVLADLVEAVIAAIYLDAGAEEAKRFINEQILSKANVEDYHIPVDSKTQLQEFLQRDGDCSIVYEQVEETGPDHNKTFRFRVLINGEPGCEGTGKSKKEAEQAAAGKTLKLLEEKNKEKAEEESKEETEPTVKEKTEATVEESGKTGETVKKENPAPAGNDEVPEKPADRCAGSAELPVKAANNVTDELTDNAADRPAATAENVQL